MQRDIIVRSSSDLQCRKILGVIRIKKRFSQLETSKTEEIKKRIFGQKSRRVAKRFFQAENICQSEGRTF